MLDLLSALNKERIKQLSNTNNPSYAMVKFLTMAFMLVLPIVIIVGLIALIFDPNINTANCILGLVVCALIEVRCVYVYYHAYR